MHSPLPSPPPPLSLYLHLPWCIRKCPYCDFNSHELDVSEDLPRYVDALIEDLRFEQPLIGVREIISVFIGGGTPSLFPAEEIARLLERVSELFQLAVDIEVTLEANPGAVEAARFVGYRRAGVNRLSVGVQSFSDSRLASLGRVHNAADAARALDTARTAGFDNINLDLMFGLPGQSSAEASADIEAALRHAPEHLSYYQLTLEPNTRFAAFPPALPDEESTWSIQRAGLERLQLAGYTQYEISAFSQPGRRCRHNVNYWTFGDYLGIGAGAHGKVTLTQAQSIERRARVRSPAAYTSRAGDDAVLSERRILDEADLRAEFAMNALRLEEGFGLDLFARRTGLSASVLDGAIAAGERRGLLQRSGEHLRTTELGWRFLDDLVALFL